MNELTALLDPNGNIHAAQIYGEYIVLPCGLNVNRITPSYVLDKMLLENVNCVACLQAMKVNLTADEE